MLSKQFANGPCASRQLEISGLHQDSLQDQLRKLLGHGFNLMLFCSGGQYGGRYCHVQIHHDKSGIELELHGVFDERFVHEACLAIEEIKKQVRLAIGPLRGIPAPARRKAHTARY